MASFSILVASFGIFEAVFDNFTEKSKGLLTNFKISRPLLKIIELLLVIYRVKKLGPLLVKFFREIEFCGFEAGFALF